MSKAHRSISLRFLGVSALALVAFDTAASAQVEEIIVTARKRDENLIEVPVSVAAFSTEQLRNAGIDNPQDLAKYVPGVDFQNAASGVDGRGSNPDIRIRGVFQQLATPSTQVGAIFYDGSYMGAGAALVPIDDLQRVEVIKGPQTAYFGRNTFSGAINYIPNVPGDKYAGKAEVMYSPTDDDSWKVAVSGGGPLTDKVGMRLSGTWKRDGGDYRYGDGTPLARYNSKALSGVVTVNPVDSVRLKISGYYVNADDTYVNAGVNWTVGPGQCRKTFTGNYINTATGVKTPFTRDLSTLTQGEFCGTFPRGGNIITPAVRIPTPATSTGGTLNLPAATTSNINMAKYLDSGLPNMPGAFGGEYNAYRYQLSGEIDLPGEHLISFIASRAVTGSSVAFDNNFGIAVGNLVFPRGNQTWVREAYYEARISSPQKQRFRYMLGVTDYTQHYRNGQTGTVLNVNFENNGSTAVFGSLDFDILENLTASAEGRYTKDDSFVRINGDPTLPAGNITVTRNASNSFKKFIPRAILTYKPWDRGSIYASWSRSALIGSQTNARVVSGLDPVLVPNPAIFGDFTAPQQNTAYELGWKQQYDKFAFTAALYYMSWKNQVFQTTVLAGAATTQLSLSGESKYKGIDVSVFADPTSWLSLTGGFNYVDAQLVRFASRSSFESVILNSGSLAVVSDGYRPRGVPAITGNLGVTVHGELANENAWYVRTDVLYTGDLYGDNEEFNRDPGAATVNLRAGVDLRKGLTLEVFSTNLLNLKRLPPIAFTTPGIGGRKIFTPVPKLRDVGMRLLAEF